MKLCAKCEQEPRARHVSYCRECWNAYQSEYRRHRYRADAAYRDSIKAQQRMIRYGVSAEIYAEMVRSQGGRCAICDSAPGDKGLGVDHDHATGAVRGLLCDSCNGAIGMLQENPALFARAIDYLTRAD